MIIQVMVIYYRDSVLETFPDNQFQVHCSDRRYVFKSPRKVEEGTYSNTVELHDVKPQLYLLSGKNDISGSTWSATRILAVFVYWQTYIAGSNIKCWVIFGCVLA